ncbi:hypothetical protein [Thalassospira marina]|nr:hypothetical protein [Thalassospira marina]
MTGKAIRKFACTKNLPVSPNGYSGEYWMRKALTRWGYRGLNAGA